MKYIKISFLLSILFVTSPLYSFGIGINISSNFNYYKFNNFIYPKANPDLKKTEYTTSISPGFSITLDTNLSKNKLFNYRLNFGVERMFLFFNDPSKFYRFNLINIFGFNVYSNELIRLFIGPILGLHYISGKRTIEYFGYVPVLIIPTIYFGPFKQKIEYGSFNMDTGLNIGINFNFTKSFTFAIDLGLTCSYAAGDINRKIVPNLELFYSNEDFRTIGFESRLDLSCFYRINDDYSI